MNPRCLNQRALQRGSRTARHGRDPAGAGSITVPTPTTRYVLGPGGNSRDFWDTLAAMEAATDHEARKALVIL